MALSFDFSLIIRRLDRTINDLIYRDGDKFFPTPPLIRENTTTLRECLEEMTKRGIRTCLIHFPKGTAEHRRLLFYPRRTSTSSAASSQKDLGGIELKNPQGESARSNTPTIHISQSPRGLLSKTDETSSILDKWAHDHYAFLDMRDVLCLLFEKYDDIYGPNGEKSDRPARQFLDDLLDTQAGDVANLSGRNSFTTASDKNTLRELLQRFENSPRVPVFEISSTSNEEFHASILGVFSVADFLQLLNTLTSEESSSTVTGFVSGGDPLLLFAKKSALTSVDTWTAGMIKNATQPARAKKYSELHICFEDESLFDAMKVLYKTGFSAIPIVSHSNLRNCIGVFSVRDLQPILLQTSDLISGALLSVPIMDYVSSICQMQNLKARYPVIHLRSNATIDAVIGKILASNVRRLLLTDDEGLLSGILSVTDLGRFIARELAGKPI